MKKTSTKTPKSVNVIARYQIKANNHVVYRVRSSNGKDEYRTTLVRGIATGCSCPAGEHGIHKCYHMTQLEQREAERQAEQQERERKEAAKQKQERMSWEQYCAVFDPCYVNY